MQRKFTAIVLALCVLLLTLTACGSKGNNGTNDGTDANGAAARRSANELAVGIAQDLDESLDPHYAVAAGTREVMFNVFEGLLKPDPDGNLIPAVAKAVDVENDGTTVRITLRENVKFHNGAAVTLRDVLYSLDRNRDETGGEALIPALTAIETAETTGENELTLTLSEANPEFLSYLTFAIIPADYTEQATAPVGTGPYKFISRKALDNIVLERFDDYWGEKAHIQKVTYKIIENAEGLLLGLQSGALDLVNHLTVTQAASVKSEDFEIREGTMNLVQALYLNNAVKPFDDLRVRQALCYGVDRQKLLDLAFDGHGTLLGSSMYPAFTKYFDASLTDTYSYDPAKAKSLLAEAGYPDGFEMTVTVPSNYQPHMDTAEVLVDQLGKIGVKAKIDPVEWGVWVDDVYTERKFMSTVIGVDASSMTARAMLERFVSDYGKNFINYNDPDYDRLFAEAQKTFDDGKQVALYKQMEKNLAQNAASVYIQDLADMVAVRKGLTGLTFYPVYVLDVAALSWSGQ